MPEPTFQIFPDGVQHHPQWVCEDGTGRPCCIHSPSNHHMNQWTMFIRLDRSGLAERFCEHVIKHPDPDSVAYFKSLYINQDWETHECDGCCNPSRPVLLHDAFNE